jgi:hypothetical protein
VLLQATSERSDGDYTTFVIFGIIAVIVSIAGTIVGYRAMKRRVELEAIAAKAGLQYSESDPFGCTRVAFPLFRKGDGRGAENVVWRDHEDGRSFRAFDFWFYDESEDQYGRTSRSYHRYSCALAYMGSSWPELVITKEGLLEKAYSALGSGDIDFESEEFNRTFAVRCDDRRFASAFIDARMIELLLTTKGELSFALRGRWLLVWRKPVPARLVPGMLVLAERFVEAIPRVVWDLYPSTFTKDDGTVLPAEDLGVLGNLDPSVLEVMRAEEAEKGARDPKVEYDLDGKPLPQAEEDPWGDGRALR